MFVKTASVAAPGVVSVDDADAPGVNNGDVLVRMMACGICGSDIEKVYGRYGQPSMKLGHEPAGIVAKVGPGVEGFSKGDRVFTHHHVPCYECHLCKRGSETMCPRYYQSNLSPCGLSEEYVVPEWNVRRGGILHLSDSTSFDEAAMIEPLACCIRAWGKYSHSAGDSVAVFGMGATGMLHALLARNMGLSDIFCLDVNEFRLGFAGGYDFTTTIRSTDPDRIRRITSATGGRGADLSIVATGSLKALADAIDATRSGGTVMMFGVPSGGDLINMDMGRIYSKEITIATSYAASDRDTAKALDMIESSEIDVGGLVTHHYALEESQQAFDRARSGRDAMKVIITG